MPENNPYAASFVPHVPAPLTQNERALWAHTSFTVLSLATDVAFIHLRRKFLS